LGADLEAILAKTRVKPGLDIEIDLPEDVDRMSKWCGHIVASYRRGLSISRTRSVWIAGGRGLMIERSHQTDLRSQRSRF
jgi:hypothetical protein